MDIFKKLFSGKQTIFRHALTVIAIGTICYLAYREYSKMMERLEIIANELYKTKQQIIILKKQNSKQTKKPIRNPYKIQSKYNKSKPITKINPITVQKQSSMEKIAKHLPTKTQELQTIIENAHNEFPDTEDAKIINLDTIDHIQNKEQITYDSDSDLITDSEELLDSEEDDILSDNSNNSDIINIIDNELQEELNAEIGDLDLEAELNTEIGNSLQDNINIEDDKQMLKEEIEKLAEVVEQEIITESTHSEASTVSQIQEENIKTNDNSIKVFGIDTSTIKEEKSTPKSKNTPKKRKGRKGLVTSWTAFMKDETIENEILTKYPDADFGQISKLKGQIWRQYTNEQKEVYKQKAKELTKLKRSI